MKRLFVAIKVSPDQAFLSQYSAFKRQLSGSRITWVEPTVMHMTLKFLGKTEDHQIPVISNVLDHVAKQQVSFPFSLDHLGIFGSSYQPRVVWLGASNPLQMATFGEDILNSLHHVGFLRDRQNFVPHLSLGRIKQLDNKKYFQEVMDLFRCKMGLSFVVDEFALYQSILQSSGPKYHQISRFKLKTII